MKIKELVYYQASISKEGADMALQNLDLAINILHSSNMPVPEHIRALTPDKFGKDNF